MSPELTQRLREYIIRELSRTPGLTLEGKPLSGFLIDSSITNVSRRLTDQWVEISCEVSIVVGRLPSRAMVMMTSGGATVQAPRRGLAARKEKSLQLDALEGAVQGAHENLPGFFEDPALNQRRFANTSCSRIDADLVSIDLGASPPRRAQPVEPPLGRTPGRRGLWPLVAES